MSIIPAIVHHAVNNPPSPHRGDLDEFVLVSRKMKVVYVILSVLAVTILIFLAFHPSASAEQENQGTPVTVENPKSAECVRGFLPYCPGRYR